MTLLHLFNDLPDFVPRLSILLPCGQRQGRMLPSSGIDSV
jgi:hypothetical protein